MNINSLMINISAAQKAAPEMARLRKAASGVEGMFLKDLLGTMRKSTPHLAIGKEFGGEMFRDMLDQTLAETAGSTGAVGIASLLEKSFGKTVFAQARAQTLREIKDGGSEIA